jgi:hypothetical protein
LDYTNKDLKELDYKWYVKKPIPIKAVKINEPFTVDTLEGRQYKGKAGDYLMVGIKSERYICDKDIFEESYEEIVSDGDNE